MAREHLDISIENLEKAPQVLDLHADELATVVEKVDGTKLTIIRNHVPWQADATKNWIVSYKSNLINPEDFHGLQSKHDSEIRNQSTGISQYKLVWDLLKSHHENSKDIPCGTEIFVEFVMRKPTLTRQYDEYHALIVIASSPSTWTVQAGKVFSNPECFDVSHNAEYARMLGMQTARVLHVGKLETSVQSIKSRYLSMPSQFGGKMEGVVIEFADGSLYKLVQDDQYDKSARAANKALCEPADAESYWKAVRLLATGVVSELHVGDDFLVNVGKISHQVYGGPDLNLDANKASINAKDDVFLTAKNMLMRATPGNNGALFLGRMSPITVAHYGIIQHALDKYDTVTVNIVKSKLDSKNPFPVDMQLKMLDLCFGDKVETLVGTTGNLATILQKSKHMINVVIAGTDRIAGYADQLKRSPDVKVEEIPRTNEVSGTLVRQFIVDGDVEAFKRYTPSAIWPLFDELRKQALAVNT